MRKARPVRERAPLLPPSVPLGKRKESTLSIPDAQTLDPAALLAAAPDLLEALEELVVTADNMRAWIERQAAATPEDHAAIARARAAIAKAKGESA